MNLLVQQLYTDGEEGEAVGEVRHQPVRHLAAGQSRRRCAGSTSTPSSTPTRKWLQRGLGRLLHAAALLALERPEQRYDELLNWWAEQNAYGRHLWPGNYTSRVLGEGANWPASELLEQVRLTRAESGARGNVHFSMSVFMQNRDSLGDRLVAGPYALPALVPASPWLDKRAPSAPRAQAQVDSLSGRTTVTISRSALRPRGSGWCGRASAACGRRALFRARFASIPSRRAMRRRVPISSSSPRSDARGWSRWRREFIPDVAVGIKIPDKP